MSKNGHVELTLPEEEISVNPLEITFEDLEEVLKGSIEQYEKYKKLSLEDKLRFWGKICEVYAEKKESQNHP